MKRLFIASLALAAIFANAELVEMTVKLANPILESGKTQKTYLRVGLTADAEISATRPRPPANVALVIDRSSSMQGRKIEEARNAAIMALQRLNSQDIVSIVAYSDGVSVLVPATKLSDRAGVERAIQSLQARGSTALFAGVSKGAAEVRKFASANYINRVILLSDGQANRGPSSPGELGELGASLIKEGITVSTIGLGLGYNEDLMAQLALRSDGAHRFAESATELAMIFDREFGALTTVLAQQIKVRIDCAKGVTIIRPLGIEMDCGTHHAHVTLNQLQAKREKYLLLEVEVDPTAFSGSQAATAKVEYSNVITGQREAISGVAGVSFTEIPSLVKAKQDGHIIVDAVEQVVAINDAQTVIYADKGDVHVAIQNNDSNLAFVASNMQDDSLNEEQQARLSALETRVSSRGFSRENWERERKKIREEETESRGQNSRSSGIFDIFSTRGRPSSSRR